jgi:hypothetical protein
MNKEFEVTTCEDVKTDVPAEPVKPKKAKKEAKKE